MPRFLVTASRQVVEDYEVTVDAESEEQARRFVELKIDGFDLDPKEVPMVLDTIIEVTNGRGQPEFDDGYVADYIEEYGDQ